MSGKMDHEQWFRLQPGEKRQLLAGYQRCEEFVGMEWRQLPQNVRQAINRQLVTMGGDYKESDLKQAVDVLLDKVSLMTA